MKPELDLRTRAELLAEAMANTRWPIPMIDGQTREVSLHTALSFDWDLFEIALDLLRRYDELVASLDPVSK